MTLTLKLLGTPAVYEDDEPIEGFISVKSRALLYYLAMKPGVHSRQLLATLLWPETAESRAAKNLRNVLSNLRKLVGSHLEISRRTVSFRRDTSYFLDVEQFSALLERYRREDPNTGLLEEAAALYAGDFLEGFHVLDSESFEIWLTAEREELQLAEQETLLALALLYMEQADVAKGLDYVARLLTMNPYSEAGQRLKMTLLVQTGRRNEALAAYTEFHSLLDQALGVQPTSETTRLYEQIKSGDLKSAAAGSIPAVKSSQSDKLRIDWGDIPTDIPFYGRQDQLQQLEQLLTEKASASERPRFIFITGMGGVGKTALAARLVRRLAQGQGTFDYIIWRSLINAPPLAAVLRSWLSALSEQRLVEVSDALDEQIALLLTYLREQRCLLILDNFESVLEPDALTGRYRSGYGGYGQLVGRVGGSQHQSSLLITSRELPGGLTRISPGPVQSLVLQLTGLSKDAGVNLLRVRGIGGSADQLAEVVRRYSGNPLALKLVADTAQNLYAGDIGRLLGEAAVFGDIYDLLDQQFGRLTALEEEILTWLAVEREPVSAPTIWDDLAIKPHKRPFLEALQSLYSRSLLEQAPASGENRAPGEPRYMLQNVVMEFTISRFIEVLCHELESGVLDILQQVTLLKVHTREYIQETQRRLLLGPVAQWLAGRFGRAGAVDRLLDLLAVLRAAPAPLPGYAGANVLHLLTTLGEDLQGANFSNLSIWQADLREVSLVDVSFKNSDLQGSLFRGTFGLVMALAFSPDGQFLAAATSKGFINFWRLNEYQPFLTVKRPAGYDLAIAFSPDSKILAAAGTSRAIQLWTVSTGESLGQLLTGGSKVTALVFSPDGQTLYSSDDEQAIKAWDAAGRQVRWQVSTEENLILDLAVSHDGALLAGGGLDGIITLWQAQSGQPLRQLGAGGAKIHALAFSPDDALLAAASEDHKIHLWHMPSGESAGTISGHANFALSVAFHPNGNLLASGSADKTIRIWHVPQKRSVRVLQGSANWVTSVAFSPDGAVLASGGYERKIHLWQSPGGQLLHTLRGSLKMVNKVRFSPNGRLLASASYDRPLLVWDAQDGRLRHTLTGHKGALRQLAFSPDGRTLAASGDEATIRLWDAQNGRPQRTLAVDQNFVRTLAFSPDGSLLAGGVGSGYGTLQVWETATGKLRFSVPDIRVGLDYHFAFSPDSRFLATSRRDHAIAIMDIEEEAVCGLLSGHQAAVEAIRFSRDGSLMAALDRDGTLIVWQVNGDGTAEMQAQFQGQGANADLWNLAFSPNNKTIAFQLDGNTLGLFDVPAGQLLHSLDESLYGVGNLAFSRDSEFLISAGIEGHVNLWSVLTGKHYQALLGHEGMVMTMEVNPDGSRIASGDDEGIIRIWDGQTGACDLILTQPGPYEGLDISGASGLSTAQIATLKSLGAVAEN